MSPAAVASEVPRGTVPSQMGLLQHQGEVIVTPSITTSKRAPTQTQYQLVSLAQSHHQLSGASLEESLESCISVSAQSLRELLVRASHQDTLNPEDAQVAQDCMATVREVQHKELGFMLARSVQSVELPTLERSLSWECLFGHLQYGHLQRWSNLQGRSKKWNSQQLEGRPKKWNSQQLEGRPKKWNSQQLEGRPKKWNSQQLEGRPKKWNSQQLEGRPKKWNSQQLEGRPKKWNSQQLEGRPKKWNSQQLEGRPKKWNSQQLEGRPKKWNSQQLEGRPKKWNSQQLEGRPKKWNSQQLEGRPKKWNSQQLEGRPKKWNSQQLEGIT